MRELAVILTLMALAFTALFYVEHQTSVRVPVAEPPKQTHHVVYFWVCGKLTGIVLTTEPPIWWAVEDGTPPDNIVELMLKAESSDRSVKVTYWHPGCFPLPLPGPEERT